MTRIIGILCLLAGLVILSCSAKDESRDYLNDGTLDGTGSVSDDLGTGSHDGSGEDSVSETFDTNIDTECDAVDFNVTLVPPRLMILVDASASMDETVSGEDAWGSGEPSKMQIANEALSAMVTQYAGYLHFGADSFPTAGSGCDVHTAPTMDVVQSSSPAAASALPNLGQGSSTPLYCGMGNFLVDAYAPVFLSDEATKYLLVVSDGADYCGEGCCTGLGPKCTATTEEFGDLAKRLYEEQDVMTFAIGFGAGVLSSSVAKEDLNAIMKNGGTGYSKFFDAANHDELSDALQTIADATVSCTFKFDDLDANADRNQINLYFDGVLVKHNPDPDCAGGEGWRWVDGDKTEVELCPAACETVKKGDVETVSAKFGCATVVV